MSIFCAICGLLLLFCREQNAMILRPRHFQSHDLKYLIHLERPNAALAPTPTLTSYTCWRVPLHLQQQHWLDLLNTDAAKQLQDQLQLVDGCKVLAILGKMESPEYIHSYLVVPAGGGATAVKRFELARYGLEFELQDGQLTSCDYQGYKLRLQQQLVHVAEVESYGSASAFAAADRDGGADQNDDMSTSSLASEASSSADMASSSSSSGGLSSMSVGGGSSSSLNDGLSVNGAEDGHVAGLKKVQYTLPEFRQYLVLERMEGSGVVLGAGKADTLVLVPATKIGVLPACHTGEDGVVMNLSRSSGAKLKVWGGFILGLLVLVLDIGWLQSLSWVPKCSVLYWQIVLLY
jgi:hypothetical protein